MDGRRIARYLVRMADTTTVTLRRRPSMKVRNSGGKPCRIRSQYDSTDEVVDIFDGLVFFVNVRTGRMYACWEQDVIAA